MFGFRQLRPHFGLRTLLIGVTVVCLLLTALPFEARQYHQHKGRARNLIVNLGGAVDTIGYNDEPSPGANWLSQWLGYTEPRESLWKVTVFGTSVSAQDLEKLSDCHWIRALDLSHTQIGDDALRHIAELKELRELRLRKTPISDAGLLELKPLRRLLILDVAGTAATYACLAELEQSIPGANLQEQYAISRARAAGIVVDLGASTLRRSSQAVPVSLQEQLELLGSPPDVAGSIRINWPLTLKKQHIEDLRRLVSAHSFETSGAAFPKGGLKFLTNLKKLQSVSFDEARTGNLTDDDLRWLAQLPCLTKVELYSPNLSDAGIAHLADAPQLTSLAISGNRFTDDVFASFRDAHQLESLSVHGNNLTPNLLIHLRGLRGLHEVELNLWHRGADRIPFARPPSKVIETARQSMHHLAGIPKLKQLSVRGNLMLAEVLEPVTNLSTLELLQVDGRYVSHEDHRQLQLAMPRCHVQRMDRD